MTASPSPHIPPPASPAVARRYARLLHAYPRGSRRAELLDTLLLAAADEGRTHPSARQAVNLLLTGARARLGRPRSTGIVVLAVLISLAAGLYTAAAASALAWRVAAPPLPNAAQLAEISTVVTPGRPALAATESGLFYTSDEGVRFDTADYQAPDYAATLDLPGFSAALQNRLESDGWDIRGRRFADGGVTSSGLAYGGSMTLTAARDRWLISIDTDEGPGGAVAGADTVTVSVERLSPGPVRAATLAGLLPGLVLGWLLTGWVSRRTERSPMASYAIAVMTIFPLLALFFMAYAGAAMKLATEIWDGTTGAEPFWQSLVYSYEAGFLSVFATVMAVVVLLIAALAPRRRAAARFVR